MLLICQQHLKIIISHVNNLYILLLNLINQLILNKKQQKHLQQVMGIQNSLTQKNIEQSGYLDEWETIDHMSNFNLVKNIKTNQLGEARKYKLDPSYDPFQELKIYELRKQSIQSIVKAYSAQILKKVSKKIDKQKNMGICASNNHIGVVTERIKYLLNDIPQLYFPQSLYVLKQCLKGYEHLYPRIGPVHITNKMIGVNNNNNIKVWINEDFSQNHPNLEIKSLLSTRNLKLDREYNMIAPQYRDQKQMIENIVDIVEEKCQNKNGEFYNLMRQNCYSFKNVRNFLQNFIRDRQINLPNMLQNRSIKNKFDNSQELKKILYRTSSQMNFLKNQYPQTRPISSLPTIRDNQQNQNRSLSQTHQFDQIYPRPQLPLAPNPPLNYPRYSPPVQNIYPPQIINPDLRSISSQKPNQLQPRYYQPPPYPNYPRYQSTNTLNNTHKNWSNNINRPSVKINYGL